MANEEVLGPRKTMFVLVIVVGCFAVLWPRILSPLMLGPSRDHLKSNQRDRDAGCCEVIFETELAILELLNEVCSSAVHVDGKLSPYAAAECRKTVNETCGLDIAAFLKRSDNVGKTSKMLVETMKNSNSSCLKEHFGVPVWSHGSHLAQNAWMQQDTVKQERPSTRGAAPHPALRERGRAIPAGVPPPARASAVVMPPHVRVRSSPLSVYYELDIKPPPIPGMRPPLGSPGGPVPTPKSSMGFVMPIYTICIIVFFVYTLSKILFKRTATTPYEAVSPDPQFRRRVFRDDSRTSPDKLVVTAISGLVAEVQQQMEANYAQNQQRQDVQDNHGRPYTNGTILHNSGPVHIVASEYRESSKEKSTEPHREKEPSPIPEEPETAETKEFVPKPEEPIVDGDKFTVEEEITTELVEPLVVTDKRVLESNETEKLSEESKEEIKETAQEEASNDVNAGLKTAAKENLNDTIKEAKEDAQLQRDSTETVEQEEVSLEPTVENHIAKETTPDLEPPPAEEEEAIYGNKDNVEEELIQLGSSTDEKEPSPEPEIVEANHVNLFELTDDIKVTKSEDIAKLTEEFLREEGKKDELKEQKQSTPELLEEAIKDEEIGNKETDEQENASVKVVGMEVTSHAADGGAWSRPPLAPPPPAAPQRAHEAEEVKSIYLETEIPQQSRVLVADFAENRADKPVPTKHSPMVVSGKMTLSLIQDAPRETPERDPESTMDEFTTASAITQNAAEKGEESSDEEIEEEIEVEEIEEEIEEEVEEEEPEPRKVVEQKADKESKGGVGLTKGLETKKDTQKGAEANNDEEDSENDAESEEEEEPKKDKNRRARNTE